MAKPTRRPYATTVKRLDYEEVRAYVAVRHKVDDADFWSYISRDHEGSPRYAVVDVENVLIDGCPGAVEFAGALYKEYRDPVLVFDLRARRRIMEAQQKAASAAVAAMDGAL